MGDAMHKLNRCIICLASLLLSCILPAAGQVQPCQQGTFADVLGTSCPVGSLVLNFRTPFTGAESFTQQGSSTFNRISPSDIGFIPVQVNSLSGYKLVLNFVTGPGTDSTFVGSHLVQFGYTPSSAPGFEIRAVQLQIDATAQAPAQGTAIEDVLDFQVYPNTGFQATDAFFAIDPSFTFPPEHLTDHFFLEVPSTLSTGGASFDPLTTQISDFVLGTGSGTLTSATFLFQMEPILPAPPEAPLTYTNIDIPRASSSGASNINSSGQIVGSYVDSLGTQHAYVTDNRGGFTTFDFPGAVSTLGSGINDQGDVSGSYKDTAGTSHGFLLSHGNLSTLDPPGSIFTLVFQINDRGQIVGEYDPGTGPLHGFLFENGTFTDIDQGVVPDSFSFTEAVGINNSGQIAGDFFDPNMFRSFTDRSNVFQQFEVPSQADTFMGGINDRGDIVGTYFDTNFSLHGFLNTQGNFQTVDFPGASTTFALGINASGKIVGQYDNGDSVSHAFLAEPGAGNSGPVVPLKSATIRHAPDKPICGSGDLRQAAQSGLRAQPCKVHR
jgi:probable HAF family extracellular repeat protein